VNDVRHPNVRGFRIERYGEGPWILVYENDGRERGRYTLNPDRDYLGLDFNGDAMGALLNAVRVERGYGEERRQYEIRDEALARIRQTLSG
jgi:hypothetical protein